MSLQALLFFIFVHFSLLVPGYAFVKNIGLFAKRPGFSLIFAYVTSMVFLGILSTLGYVLKLSPVLLAAIGWLVIVGGVILFVKQRLYRDILALRFPLICFILMSLLSCAFINLSYPSQYEYLPDPQPQAHRNYEVLNVKVLNLARTQANDNSVPYRQAQFFLNRSDPANDCFICEWGVHFFQRTPFMGAVTAGYFTLLQDKPPVGYLWDSASPDPSSTYVKFQILAQILNALFIIPAFYLLKVIFNKKTAMVSSLLLIGSPFFLYNAFFSWPKSLVAFFVLASWLLLFERKTRFTVLAGIVGGLAYLTHDLAVFYIGASIGLLVLKKRFRDTFIFGALSALFVVPWIMISAIIYKKPSTFVLYPFSLHGLPQAGQQRQIISEFLHTSPVEIISIRLDTLFYLLSPYDLIYSGGGQAWLRRIWAVGIFSIPGSLGLGLALASIMGAFKKMLRWEYWMLVLIPIFLAAAIVGWRGSRAIASLHFAQAVIVLLSGLGVSYLLSLRRRLWIMLVFGLNCAYLAFMILYSYNYHDSAWLVSPGNLINLLGIASVVGFAGYAIYKIATGKTPGWLKTP